MQTANNCAQIAAIMNCNALAGSIIEPANNAPEQIDKITLNINIGLIIRIFLKNVIRTRCLRELNIIFRRGNTNGKIIISKNATIIFGSSM